MRDIEGQNSYSTAEHSPQGSAYIYNIKFEHPSSRINNPRGIPSTSAAFIHLIGKSKYQHDLYSEERSQQAVTPQHNITKKMEK
jgi:hypothetical protein